MSDVSLTAFNVKVKMDELNDNLLMTDYSITFEQTDRFNQYSPKLRESMVWFTDAIKAFFEQYDHMTDEEERRLIYETLFQRQSLIDITEYSLYVNRCAFCLQKGESMLEADSPHNPTAHIHEELKDIFARHLSTDLCNEDITKVQLYTRYLETAARPVYQVAPFGLSEKGAVKLYQDLYRMYGLIES
jgi:hypothetical protein|nr:MAG TPA: hypothetical protein [Myoviridae sp. ctfuG5]